MEKTSAASESPEGTASTIINTNLVSENTPAVCNVTVSPVAKVVVPSNDIKPDIMSDMSRDVTASGDNMHVADNSMESDGSTVQKDGISESQNINSDIVSNHRQLSAFHEVDSTPVNVVQSAEMNESPVTESAAENSELDTFSSGSDDEYMANGSGNESDIEDNDDTVLYPGQFMRRDSNPVLPETVSVLETSKGCKVYLVGTAHFSKESQEDVTQVIRAVQPDVVMVELCTSRISILQMDEKALLEEAKNINFEKVRSAIKQSGVVQGILHLLLLSMSAHITKQLGMAPGGEFRTAFIEARKVPGCRVHLGDRPIQITLRRAIAALSVFQKLSLAWYMVFNKDPISKEEVEKCKQKDLLEEMLAEMTGEYPALSNVFVHERDLYLTRSLRVAAEPLKHPEIEGEVVSSVVVGVVGIGHCKGIKDHWNDEHIDIRSIMQVPKSSLFTRSFKWIFRGALVGLSSWLLYRIGNGWILPLIWPSS